MCFQVSCSLRTMCSPIGEPQPVSTLPGRQSFVVSVAVSEIVSCLRPLHSCKTVTFTSCHQSFFLGMTMKVGNGLGAGACRNRKQIEAFSALSSTLCTIQHTSITVMITWGWFLTATWGHTYRGRTEDLNKDREEQIIRFLKSS